MIQKRKLEVSVKLIAAEEKANACGLLKQEIGIYFAAKFDDNLNRLEIIKAKSPSNSF